MIVDVNMTWISLAHSILTNGRKTQPRGITCYEAMSPVMSTVNMQQPVLTVPKRKLGYRFMAAEAAWILSGDNRVSTISQYSKAIAQFSDDGVYYFGAYGPKVRDQLSYVVDKLGNDLETRHAVINIWREQPRQSKDVPCTLSLQFFIRDGVLYCHDTMRSSDLWLGWPYDVFNMSMISLAVKILLKQVYGIDVKLGTLYLTAASQHIYQRDAEKFADIISVGKSDHSIWTDCSPIIQDQFSSIDCLIERLWTIADSEQPYRLLTKGLVNEA